MALVYDGFTFNAISWLEGLGFCGLVRPSTGSTAVAASRSMATSRSTRTVDSSPRAGPWFRVPLRSRAQLATRPGSAGGRCQDAVVTSGGGTPSGVLLLQRKDA